MTKHPAAPRADPGWTTAPTVTATGARRTGGVRPRVVLLDLGAWDSFASFGAAVRSHGMAVSRVSTRRAGATSVALALLDRLVFGRDPGHRRLRPGGFDPSSLASLLDPPTVDVEGPEDLVADLRAQFPDAASLSRARVPDERHAHLLYDKLAMTRYAQDLGIPVPATRTSLTEASFPLVLKRSVGSGGQAVRVVADEEQLARAREELEVGPVNPVFYQDYCAGQVLNYGGVARDGRLLAGSAYQATTAPDDPLGPAVAVTVLHDDQLEQDTATLLGALGYTGFFCIDFIRSPAGPALLIDVNPRVFGSWLALERTGVPLLEAYLSLYDLAPEPARARVPAGRTSLISLKPRPSVSSSRELWDQARRVWSTVGASRPLTGSRFVLAFLLRAVLVLVRAALRLGLGTRDRTGR